MVVFGGGDGTLSTGAAALLGSHKPLGILPLGSLNHFAKDVGIPLDLDQAVGTIERGYVTEVDVGEVNGRIFLNNSSIGLYPSAVAHREELRHRHGGGKWPAMFNACVDVVRRFPLLDVTLQVDDRAVALTTPFVFVGNNRYEMSLFSLGTRTSLQGGELSIYLTQDAGRMGLLRLFFRALLGRLEQDRDFHSVMLPEVEIRTRRRSLRVSLDGEVVRMASPIRYIIRPRALRVLAPMPDALRGRHDHPRAHLRSPFRDREPRDRRGPPRRPRVGRALAGGRERRPDAAGQAEGVRGRTALPGSHPVSQARRPRQSRHSPLRPLDALRPSARPLPALHRRGRGSLLLDGRRGGPGDEHRPLQHLEGRAHLPGPDRRAFDGGWVPCRRPYRRCS